MMTKIYEYNEWKTEEDPYLYSLAEANKILKEIDDPLVVRTHVKNRRYIIQRLPEGSAVVNGTTYIATPKPDNVKTPDKMSYVLFDCPEWKGNKETSVRPGVIRNINNDRMILYPLTTQYHYFELGVIEVTDLEKLSWLIVPEIAVLNVKRIIKTIGDVSSEVLAKLDATEEYFRDLINAKEQKLSMS